MTRIGTQMLSAFSRIGQAAEGATGSDILKNAKMDFEAIKTPLYDSRGTALKSRYCRVARSDTNDTLGVVSRSYHPFQNSQLMSLVEKMCQQSGTVIDRIGMVGSGEKVFMSFQMPEGFSFGSGSAEEQVDVYWYIMSSHDGSSGLKLVPSPVRLACSNQFAMLHGFLKNQGIDPRILTIRHSSIMNERVDDLLEKLNIINNLVENFTVEAAQLITVEMEQHDRISYYIDVLGLNQNEDVMNKKHKEYDATNPYGLGTRGNNTLDALLELEGSESNTVGEMAGTAWGAFNTVTEFIDYGWTYNKDGTPNEKRMESAIMGPAANMKNKAFQLLTV